MKTLIGCDPEFFVSRDGSFVPICGLLGGTKSSPTPLKGVKEKGFAYQEDGAAAEFNIPPAETAYEFSGNVEFMLSSLTKLLAERGLAPMRETRSIKLTKEHILAFPQLETLGCDPDRYAYGSNNGKISASTPRTLTHGVTHGIRGVGGHVHIGYDKEVCPPDVLAQLLDCVLALQVTGIDIQGPRRLLWGKPGLFREKPYGIEYRTLSNFWIWDPALASAVALTCILLIESLKENQIAWQAFFNRFSTTGMGNVLYYINLEARRERALVDQKLVWMSGHAVYRDLIKSVGWDKVLKG